MKKKRGRGRPKGSKGRKKVEKKMELCSPEKVALIKKIWKLEPEFKALDIDLTERTIEELKKHIKLFKKRNKK